MPSDIPHMTSDQFREAGHRMIDFVADYWEALAKQGGGGGHGPVLAACAPGALLDALPAHAPAKAEDWDAIVRDVERLIMPGLTHWQSPGFFAYFPANVSGPAVLGELLSAGLGVNGMLWATSPAATELEIRMLDWLAGMLDLPHSFTSASPTGGGVIQGTASEATLAAILAARTRARTAGADDSKMVVYASTQAHSSIMKGAMIAGIARHAEDHARVRLIRTDAEFRMSPALFDEAVRKDLSAGLHPTFVCASVGTTSSTAIDPLPAIGAIANSHRMWLHVDAAHAGAACICPEHRGLLAGVETADSLGFNPHKWMLTNFDCNLMWTRDRAALIGALSITPEYLRNRATDDRAVIDYRDWHVPLGRRFRALKLWFVVRHYGVDGLRAYIREHIRLAELFESWVRADDRFVLCAPRTMNLVCFRLADRFDPPGSNATKSLLESVNAGGRVFMSHTVLGGNYVIRMCIGGTHTREEHVREAWDLLRAGVRG